jgi:hypothetical protein
MRLSLLRCFFKLWFVGMVCRIVSLVTVIVVLFRNFGKLCSNCCSARLACRRVTILKRTVSLNASTVPWNRCFVVSYLQDNKIGMYGYRLQSLLLTRPNLQVPSLLRSMFCMVMSRCYLCSRHLVKLVVVWFSLCLIAFWPCRKFLAVLRTI